jgi:hypothetical protein
VSRHLSLSWARSLQYTLSLPTCLRSILLLSSHLQLGLTIVLFPTGFPTTTLHAFFFHLRRKTGKRCSNPYSWYVVLAVQEIWVINCTIPHKLQSSCCAILCCFVKLCYVMLTNVMLWYAVLWYAMLCYVVLCCAVLCCVMLCCVVLCCAVLCYVVMLCYAMLCYAMLCYAMLCYATLCYVMLCYVAHTVHIPTLNTSTNRCTQYKQ